jgi:hypothetical protein
VNIDDLDFLLHAGKLLDEDPRKIDLPDWFRGKRADIHAKTVRDFLIEALLKVRSKTRGLVALQPNLAQAEYSHNCSRRNIVLKARQVGVTTYIAARFFIQTITQPGTVSLQVAHDQESAEDIFRIVHRFRENLPEEMQQGALRTSRANVRQIAFPQLDSEYRVATAADENAGRGTTVHNLHCSEVARWPGHPQETLTSLRAAVPEHGDIVLESTPRGAGGVFYDEWQQAAETEYTRHFFPWWYEEAYCLPVAETDAALNEQEAELVERAGLTLEQIAWRRNMRSQVRGLALQEYAEDPMSCFRASGECVFEVSAIEDAAAAARAPLEVRDNERWMMWFPPQPNSEYIVGADPAGGGADGDFSCAQVIDRETGLQCAELHGHFPLRVFGRKLVEIANRFNQALLVVERNNHGHAVLVHVQNIGYANLYRTKNGEAGWLTTMATRPMMIENLESVLAAAPESFHSKRFLNECRSFVRHADGSASATSGTHDDCVIAMAIAHEARKRGPAKYALDPPPEEGQEEIATQ